MSAFSNELFQNGETGVPQSFHRVDGHETTEEDYLQLVQTLSEAGVEVEMGAYSVSSAGREAIVKTAVAIPAEILKLIGTRNHLGRLSIQPIMY